MIIRLYDFLKCHKALRILSLVLLTAILLGLALTQSYQEDISAFLPLNSKYQESLRVYQETSGANRIFAIFTSTSPDSTTQTIDRFVSIVERRDTSHMVQDLTSQIDLEKASGIAEELYSNIPYLLSDEDYQRIDSLLDEPDYISEQLIRDKQMLMFPVSGLLQDNLQRDPLNLYTPTVARLSGAHADVAYEDYNGYIFTPDMSRAIVMMTSPFGASETEKNAQLLTLLEQAAQECLTASPSESVSIHFTGGPVIAVGNARQIKTDSLIAISLAVILIVALLYYVFRKWGNLLLIVISIAWGWLFAMGMLALIHDNVSIIVIGMSSIIVGIAVNYPLHLIAHLQHTPDIRLALKEIVKPLVVGNITTVGAFLALVPLQSAALRDLGLFSSLLLIGTILFVLIWLPHFVIPPLSPLPLGGVGGGSCSPPKQGELERARGRVGETPSKRWVVVAIVLLTVFFGYFSLDTTFDANIGHINYMSDEQRADLALLASGSPGSTGKRLVVTSDSTLENSLDESRIERWNAFVNKYGKQLQLTVDSLAKAEGFAPGTFDPFLSQLTTKPPLGESLGRGSLHLYELDVESMNSAIATSLSDDFNYIGWVCGLIVFCFLWFSFRSIRLAIISFVPMAVSWIWILGLMAILDIQFNVVNVILATFIFGQGDDYTIFITEGCLYEQRYHRPMLASYKNSIIISALIMFIGIGTLILARHPALHSLAEVTIVGMFSVVLMAWLLPPILFKWLVARNLTQ